MYALYFYRIHLLICVLVFLDAGRRRSDESSSLSDAKKGATLPQNAPITTRPQSVSSPPCGATGPHPVTGRQSTASIRSAWLSQSSTSLGGAPETQQSASSSSTSPKFVTHSSTTVLSTPQKVTGQQCGSSNLSTPKTVITRPTSTPITVASDVGTCLGVTAGQPSPVTSTPLKKGVAGPVPPAVSPVACRSEAGPRPRTGPLTTAGTVLARQTGPLATAGTVPVSSAQTTGRVSVCVCVRASEWNQWRRA